MILQVIISVGDEQLLSFRSSNPEKENCILLLATEHMLFSPTPGMFWEKVSLNDSLSWDLCSHKLCSIAIMHLCDVLCMSH